MITEFPQIIVTGLPVTSFEATAIRNFSTQNNLFATDWCHPDGTIGFIDSSKKFLNVSILKDDLSKLAKEFPILQIGITVMNGPPGRYNMPMYQFSLIKGKITPETISPHFHHPPPKRLK